MNDWVEFGLVIALLVLVTALFATLCYFILRRPVVAVLLAAVASSFFLNILFSWMDGGVYWIPISVSFVAIAVEALLPAGITVWLLRRRWRRPHPDDSVQSAAQSP